VGTGVSELMAAACYICMCGYVSQSIPNAMVRESPWPLRSDRDAMRWDHSLSHGHCSGDLMVAAGA
jgi:hypothetical protein